MPRHGWIARLPRALKAAFLAAAVLAVGAPPAQGLPGKFWGVVPQAEPAWSSFNG